MRHFDDSEIECLQSSLSARGVISIIGTFLDNSGVARAKQVPLDRLKSLHRNGLGASYSWSVWACDDSLMVTPEFSVTGDMRMRADLDALRILDATVAWVPLNLFDQDGNALDYCPRGISERTDEQLRAQNFETLAAFEVEATWFNAETGEVGPRGGYSLQAMLDSEDFYRDITVAFNDAGLPLEQLHAEAGLGQIELSTQPASLVTAADNLVVSRLILGRVSRVHKKHLSFSPSSLEDGIGNGAHLHMSLTRGGSPIFSGGSESRSLTAEGTNAIGGLIKWLPEALGILSPSLLSSSRLTPGKWSGAWLGWGVENREAAVRLCQATPGNPYGANIEIKVTDHTANPYVAAATIAGLALRGIRENVTLPPELPANPNSLSTAERAELSIKAFPTHFSDNLKATVESNVVRDLLGETMVKIVDAVRSREVEIASTSTFEQLVKGFRFAWSS